MKEKIRAVLLFGMILGGGMFPGSLDAQEGSLNSESLLDRTLESLKDSVIKLVEDNNEIARASKEVYSRVKGLQSDLAALEKERLKKQALLQSLQEKKEKKSGGGERLALQLERVRNELADVRREKDVLQREMDQAAGDEEQVRSRVEALIQEIAELKGAGSSAEVSAEMMAFRQERDRLLQETQVASTRLAKAREEWQEISRISVAPAGGETGRKEAEKMRQEIATIRAEMPGLREQAAKQEEELSSFLAHGNTAEFLSDLEADLTVQEEGVKALQRDLAALNQKTSQEVRKVEPKREPSSRTLARQYQEARSRQAQLRADLGRLRQEMIRLDKKKAAVEREIY